MTATNGVQHDVIGDVTITSALCQSSEFTPPAPPTPFPTPFVPGPSPTTTPEPTTGPSPTATPEPTTGPSPTATPEPTTGPSPTATPVVLDPAGRTLRKDPCIASDGGTTRPLTVFMSYLVPSAAEAPATLQTTGSRGTGTLTPTSAADSAQLTSGASAPAGYKWVSYRSPSILNLQSGESGLNGTITAHFKVDGLTGDFAYGQFVGWRWGTSDTTDTEFADTRAVSCGNPMAVPISTTLTNCDVAHAPDALLASATHRAGRDGSGPAPAPSPADLLSVPVSHLAVTAPAAATVAAGTTARVTFGQTSTLAAGATISSVPVTATTTIPRGVVTAPSTLTIGAAGNLVADVTIPASTPAGSYDVQLNVGESSGLHRATATVRVPAAATPTPSATPAIMPPPTATPTVTVTVTPSPSTAPKTTTQLLADSADALQDIVERPKKGRQLRKGAMTVPVTVPVPGTVRVTLLGRKKIHGKLPPIAYGIQGVKEAGRVNVTIKRTAYGRQLQRSGDHIEATLVVRVTFAGGSTEAPGIPIVLD
jgi:hypothetical protein